MMNVSTLSIYFTDTLCNNSAKDLMSSLGKSRPEMGLSSFEFDNPWVSLAIEDILRHGSVREGRSDIEVLSSSASKLFLER